MKNPVDVIIKPIVTEKTSLGKAQNKYAFKVFLDANKIDIKYAVEKAFNVSVKAVNTINIKSRQKSFGRSMGKTGNWKKAYVTLMPGQSIKELEG